MACSFCVVRDWLLPADKHCQLGCVVCKRKFPLDYNYHIYYYDCKLTCTYLLWFLSFYHQFETIGFKKWRIIIEGAFVMNNMVLYTKAPFVFMFGKSSLITKDTYFLWTCSNTCRNQDSCFQQSKFCSTFMPLTPLFALTLQGHGDQSGLTCKHISFISKLCPAHQWSEHNDFALGKQNEHKNSSKLQLFFFFFFDIKVIKPCYNLLVPPHYYGQWTSFSSDCINSEIN